MEEAATGQFTGLLEGATKKISTGIKSNNSFTLALPSNSLKEIFIGIGVSLVVVAILSAIVASIFNSYMQRTFYAEFYMFTPQINALYAFIAAHVFTTVLSVESVVSGSIGIKIPLLSLSFIGFFSLIIGGAFAAKNIPKNDYLNRINIGITFGVIYGIVVGFLSLLLSVTIDLSAMASLMTSFLDLGFGVDLLEISNRAMPITTGIYALIWGVIFATIGTLWQSFKFKTGNAFKEAGIPFAYSLSTGLKTYAFGFLTILAIIIVIVIVNDEPILLLAAPNLAIIGLLFAHAVPIRLSIPENPYESGSISLLSRQGVFEYAPVPWYIYLIVIISIAFVIYAGYHLYKSTRGESWQQVIAPFTIIYALLFVVSSYITNIIISVDVMLYGTSFFFGSSILAAFFISTIFALIFSSIGYFIAQSTNN